MYTLCPLPAPNTCQEHLMVYVQLYFDKITELTMRKSGSILFKQALVSLATDPGLHPLLPYFTYLIADEVALEDCHIVLFWWSLFSLELMFFSQCFQVSRNLNNFSVLFGLMRVARSLLQNPNIHVEPYVSLFSP